MNPRFSILAALLSVALAGPAFASSSSHGGGSSGGHGSSGGGGEHGEKPKAEEKEGLFGSADNIVPLPTIIAPVMIDGRLTAHLYFYLAAETASAEEAGLIKEKMPYVQDALVTAAYEAELAVPGPADDPDTAPLIERFRAVINEIAGKEVVSKIEIGRIDTAPY